MKAGSKNLKFLKFLVLSVILLLGLARSAGAASVSVSDYGYDDNSPEDRWEGAVLYNLTLSETADPTKLNAILRITTTPDFHSGPATWFTNWFLLKHFPNEQVQITEPPPINPTGTNAGSGPWVIVDGNTGPILGGGGKFKIDLDRPEWTGFHQAQLDDSGASNVNDLINDGILLSSTTVVEIPYTIMSTDGNLDVSAIGDIPIQAGYYAAGNPNPKPEFNQYSGVLVPEPPSLLLIGSGLVGMAAVARKRSRRK